ncbi:MAG: hypothetical protein KAT76_02950 [Bacteroidales bacterium]|nr:hypothetical protein [Bacteroidales bacterium]
MEKNTFYSNGKLLITGEYLVLHGALALAVPTIPGQEMSVETTDGPVKLSWNSFYRDKCWFEAEFSLPVPNILKASNARTAEYLQALLLEAKKLNPGALTVDKALKVESNLGFSQEWGLGSSSSLINNVAGWFDIDPYELLMKTQKGSGYDIACARADGPIRYRLVQGCPVTRKVSFNPPYKDKLAFVYSGRKQDSAASINTFLSGAGFLEADKNRISEISLDITSAKTLQDFNLLLDEHEEIMSGVLQLPKIKEERFPGFPGSIKSLGAWGGDFFLASSEIGFEEIKSYFSKNGLKTCFSWHYLVLSIH